MKSVSSAEDIRAENWGPKGNSQYGVRRGFREKRILELGLNGEVGACWVWGD